MRTLSTALLSATILMVAHITPRIPTAKPEPCLETYDRVLSNIVRFLILLSYLGDRCGPRGLGQHSAICIQRWHRHLDAVRLLARRLGTLSTMSVGLPGLILAVALKGKGCGYLRKPCTGTASEHATAQEFRQRHLLQIFTTSYKRGLTKTTEVVVARRLLIVALGGVAVWRSVRAEAVIPWM